MDTKWLEDFVSLASTQNFRRAGEQRHVTQSALSRRIQNLEDWAGVELFYRTQPLKLTPAGEILHRTAIDVLQTQLAARAALRNSMKPAEEFIEFAVSECIDGMHFSRWLMRWEADLAPLKCRISTFAHQNAKEFLLNKYPDFFLLPNHASWPIDLDWEQYQYAELGQVILRPYTVSRPDGKPLHEFPCVPGPVVPYLAYREKSYLDELIHHHCVENGTTPRLNRIFESNSAEDLKTMAMHGHGICFLARSTVENEAQSIRLVDAAPQHPGITISFSLRLCRPRQYSSSSLANNAECLWSRVVAQQGQCDFGLA